VYDSEREKREITKITPKKTDVLEIKFKDSKGKIVSS
jgi:hypothetical protein